MNVSFERTLKGKRIAILAADGFEYVELSVPKVALLAAGAEVDVISIHAGKIRGVNFTEPTRAIPVDRKVDDVRADEYDGLLVVGGLVGPDLVRQSRPARELVRAFNDAHKPIATICHGPWVLISAGIVKGRRLAAWPAIRDDVVNAGGIWRDDPLVRDWNIVSSRGPHDLHVFVPAMLAIFERGAEAPAEGALARASHLDEISPQPDAPPLPAVIAARVLPGPTLRTAATAALVVGVGALAMRRAFS